MRLGELKDRPVVSIAQGTELGKVHGVLLDASYLQLAALVIGGGGLFGRPKQVVAYGDVRGIGPDAVMVRGREAVEEVQDGSPLAALPDQGDLQQEVISETGSQLGHVKDAELDPQSGKLTHLWYAPGDSSRGDQGMYAVAREAILSVSAKLAVVRGDGAERRPNSEEQKPG